MAAVTPTEVVGGLDLLAVLLQSIESIATAAQQSGVSGATNTGAQLVPTLFTAVGSILTGGVQQTVNEMSQGAAAFQSIITSFGNLLNIHAAAQTPAAPAAPGAPEAPKAE